MRSCEYALFILYVLQFIFSNMSFFYFTLYDDLLWKNLITRYRTLISLIQLLIH